MLKTKRKTKKQVSLNTRKLKFISNMPFECLEMHTHVFSTQFHHPINILKSTKKKKTPEIESCLKNTPAEAQTKVSVKCKPKDKTGRQLVQVNYIKKEEKR